MSKYCPHCNHPLPDEFTFCLYCCNRTVPVEAKPIRQHTISLAPLRLIVLVCVILLFSFGTALHPSLLRNGEQKNEGVSFPANTVSSFISQSIHYPNIDGGVHSSGLSGQPFHNSIGPVRNPWVDADSAVISFPHSQVAGGNAAGDVNHTVIPPAPSVSSSAEQTENVPSASPSSFSSSEAFPDTSGSASLPAVLPVNFNDYPYAAPEDFLFTSGNGEITITGYTGRNSVVRIPSKINGATVKYIAKAAFYENTGIRHLQFPEGVESIGEAACYNCASLTQVSCPSTLTEIQNDAFRECARLEYVELTEGLLSIGAYVFQDCRRLSQITLPGTLKSIAADTFANTAIRVLTLPASLTRCSVFGYGGWPALTEIRVAEGNACFYAQDGVLFMHYSTHEALTCYPPGKRDTAYTVSNANVAAYAFAGSAYLEEVTIGENAFVDSYAFEQCQRLKTVRFARQITGLASYSFGNCPALTDVYLPEVITQEFCADAFSGSANLKRLVFPAALTRMPGDGGLLNDLPNASMYVTAGSPAEAYAKRYDLPYTIYSDKG